MLMYYMGFTWESFGLGPLPTVYRRWFQERLVKEINQAQESGNNDIPSKAPHHNPYDLRMLTGKFNPYNKNPRTQRVT